MWQAAQFLLLSENSLKWCC